MSGSVQNLLDKVTTTELMQDNAIQMVQRRMPKQLELIEARKLDDEEFAEDLKWLTEKLAESVQDMSSFEEFAIEVRSASLDLNSPAHRSDRFWRENAHRLNEHNHELLKCAAPPPLFILILLVLSFLFNASSSLLIYCRYTIT